MIIRVFLSKILQPNYFSMGLIWSHLWLWDTIQPVLFWQLCCRGLVLPLSVSPQELSASRRVIVPLKLLYKTHQIAKHKWFSSGLAVVFALSIETMCSVENEDVVGAAPTGDASTTSERSTILLPTKVTYIRGLTVFIFVYVQMAEQYRTLSDMRRNARIRWNVFYHYLLRYNKYRICDRSNWRLKNWSVVIDLKYQQEIILYCELKSPQNEGKRSMKFVQEYIDCINRSRIRHFHVLYILQIVKQT